MARDDLESPTRRCGHDSRELVRASGLPESALLVVGTDYRLADPETRKVMLEACQRAKR